MGEDSQDRQDADPAVAAADLERHRAAVAVAVRYEHAITRRVIVPIVLVAVLIAVYLLARR